MADDINFDHWGPVLDQNTWDEEEDDQEARGRKRKERKKITEEEKSLRVSKRLAYLLRYGAEQEGLTVDAGGYVEVKSMLELPVMRHNTEAEVLRVVDEALSYQGTPLFEKKQNGVGVYIRARYGQRMERSQYHEGTKVTRLLDTCLGHICKHLKDYDFEGFPDLFVLNTILHKLKRDKLLSNIALKTILSSAVEHLDLEGTYLTTGTLKLLGDRCHNLRILNLRGAGYVLNDYYMEQLLKRLHILRSLNLSGCYQLKDKSLNMLAKTNPDLRHLIASGNRNFTEPAILNLILACPKLEHLDIYDNPNFTESGRRTLVEISADRKLTVILKDLTDKSVAPDDPSMVLGVWRAVMI